MAGIGSMRIKAPHILQHCIAKRETLLLLVFLFSACPSAASEAGEKALWQALKAGTAFAVMRHAIAPGTGDPENFKLGDCSSSYSKEKTP